MSCALPLILTTESSCSTFLLPGTCSSLEPTFTPDLAKSVHSSWLQWEPCMLPACCWHQSPPSLLFLFLHECRAILRDSSVTPSSGWKGGDSALSAFFIYLCTYFPSNKARTNPSLLATVLQQDTYCKSLPAEIAFVNRPKHEPW